MGYFSGNLLICPPIEWQRGPANVSRLQPRSSINWWITGKCRTRRIGWNFKFQPSSDSFRIATGGSLIGRTGWNLNFQSSWPKAWDLLYAPKKNRTFIGHIGHPLGKRLINGSKGSSDAPSFVYSFNSYMDLLHHVNLKADFFQHYYLTV